MSRSPANARSPTWPTRSTRSANLVGIAQSASQGAITGRQLDTRPMMRTGEVLETVPGVVISQHSGEGKGNQVLPARLQPRSRHRLFHYRRRHAGQHAHARARPWLLRSQFPDSRACQRRAVLQGALFRRPGRLHDGRLGQHQLRQRARAALGARWAAAGRASAASSRRLRRVVGRGRLLGALELQHNDGPWVRPDDFEKVNGLLRYSQGDGVNGFSITAMGYRGTWNSTDQIPSARRRQRGDWALRRHRSRPTAASRRATARRSSGSARVARPPRR